MKKNLLVPLLSMLSAILLIVSFQGWWLWETNKDQRRELRFRSSYVFRESIRQVQASKLKLDSSENFPFPRREEAAVVMNMMRRRVKDSIRRDSHRTKGPEPMRLPNLVKVIHGGDSSNRVIIKSIKNRREQQMLEMMLEMDSLQDPIKVNEISERLDKQLKKQGIDLRYRILTDTIDIAEEGPPSDRNKIVVGLAHPVAYKLEILNEGEYLFKKLSPQLIFSIFLIGLTVLSFAMLYKNLLRQRKLTELKNDFINNITHELKTPIATVSVAIEALKNFNAIEDPHRTREYLDISGNELNRLSMLVDKVLKLSMFEKSELELKSEPIAIDELVKAVVQSMQLQFEKQQVKVNIKLEGNNFVMHGDRLHITSVVYNLLDNALKYSKTDPEIQVSVATDESQVSLTVTDNGIGISEAYKSRIFDKFFRVPHGDTHNIKGYGLGLSYVAQVVKEHGGHIELVSTEGKGSSFKVIFPKAK